MKGIRLSIVSRCGVDPLPSPYIYFGAEHVPILGEAVRPDGTLLGGLVLHCHEPYRRGYSYTVVKNKEHRDQVHIGLPSSYIGKKVEGLRHLTKITGEAQQIDGRWVIMLERFDVETMPIRAPKKKRLSSSSPSLFPSSSSVVAPTNLERISRALHTLRRVIRTKDQAEALTDLVELAHLENVKIRFNGTEIKAIVEKVIL